MMTYVPVQRSRRWGICLLAWVVLLGGCARSPEAKRAKHLEAGKSLLQKKDYARAILEFKSAVQAMPGDAEAYYQLGVAQIASGNLQRGVASFEKAIELNPKHVDARLRMAQLMAMTTDEGMVRDAESRLKALLEDSPANSTALNTLAFTELKLGKTEDAIHSLEEVLAKAPQQLTSAVVLARVTLQQKDVKGAEAILQKACESDPKAAAPHVALGQFYNSQNQMAQAEEQFKQAIALDPKNGSVLMDLARLQNTLGRKHEAEQSFKRVAGFPGMTYKPIYAMFLFEEGRRDESIREFERLAKENPEDRRIRTQLVAAYRAANRVPDATKTLEKALEKNPKDLDALLQRGELLIMARRYEDAQRDLNQVLRLKPNSAEVHYIFSKLYQARGTLFSRKQELSQALQLNPYLVAVRLELAQVLLAGNASKAALEIMNQTPDAQKRLTSVLVERNWALWALGDLAEMRKGIDQGLSQERSADLLIQDGLWKLRAGNAAHARLALEEVLKISPDNIQALWALQRSYLAQGQSGSAVQKVKEYAAQNPKTASVQEFLGMMLLVNGDRGGARTAFNAAKAIDNQTSVADFFLSQMDLVDGKKEDARNRLKSLVAADGGNVPARLWLGYVEEARGEHQAAIEQYRKVVEVDPSNTQALNNLAYILVEYANQPDEALKYAEKARELAPDLPEYADTLGWILYRKGLYSMAIRHLERATSQNGSPVWKYHLAMAYARAGDSKRGLATLEAALKMNPNLPEAKAAKEIINAR